MSDPLTGLIGGVSSFATSLMNNLFTSEANRQTMAREDTAIQRRVADLKAAGLSPVLAAGQAAGSSPIRAMSLDNPAEAAMSMMSQKQNIAQSAAETERVQTLKDIAGLERFEKAWNLKFYTDYNLPTDIGGLATKSAAVASALKGLVDKVNPSVLSRKKGGEDALGLGGLLDQWMPNRPGKVIPHGKGYKAPKGEGR